MLNFLLKPKNQLLFLIAGCFLFVLIIRPWELYYLNDDFMHIPMNRDWLFLRSGFMRPVPNYFLMWDKALYGNLAIGYFSTSLLLHAVCVITVFFLVKGCEKLFFPEREKSLLAFITAFLFLVYPYHAEPIMWVIGRVAIIAAIFAFLSVLFYIKTNDSLWFGALSWLCLIIALFTYESIWNIILLFAFVSFFNIKKANKTVAKEAVLFGGMFVTFAAYIWFRSHVLGTVAGDGYTEINENLSKIPLLIINLVKLTGRNFTPPNPNSMLVSIVFAVSALFYGFCIFKVFKKNSFWGWFMLALWVAMVSGVVTAAPLGIDTHYNESERYIYYSSFFYCFFIGLLIVIFLSVKKQILVASGISLVFILLLFGLQNNYSKSSAITKSMVEIFAKYPGYKRAVMIDLPQKYEGTMVMRMSPQPARDWIVPQAKYDTILVPTQTINAPIILPFKTGEKEWAEIAREKKWDELKAEVPDSLNQMQQLTDKDVLFWYKPDGVYKINMPATLFQKKE